MSKIVTAVTNSVEVECQNLVLGSDGNLYAASYRKGDEIDTGHDVVLTKKGIGMVKRAAEIIREIEVLKNTLSKLSVSDCSDYDLSFEDDNGEACVKVGCTCVYPSELSDYMKALKL